MNIPIHSGRCKRKRDVHGGAARQTGRRAWLRICLAAALVSGSWAFVGDGIIQAQHTHVAAAGTTVAVVQKVDAVPQTSQSTVRVIYASAQRAGDTNIVAIGWNDTSATIRSVTDSAGNTYQVAAPLARGSGLSQAIYYAKDIKARTANGNTTTVTFNQPTTVVDVRALEYSGLDTSSPFDAAASAAGSAASAVSGAATTHAASELLFDAGMTIGAFTGAGSGYTTRIITAPDADIVEDRIVSTTGSYRATAPENGAWLMQLATFRTAGGGSNTRTPTPTRTATKTPATRTPTRTATKTPATNTPVPPTATSTSTIDPPAPTATNTIDPPAPTATPTSTVTTTTTGCGLAAPAFCDTFSEGPQAGGRSGDLDPGMWSVARIDQPYSYMGGTSPTSFAEFPSVPVAPCHTGLSSLAPDHDSLLCGGQLVTATEGQDYGLLSYRPTQRFDFTGRTGRIVFDVDAATGGGLDKWISLFVTDQPTAGANNLAQVTGLTPRNGVGINLDLTCGSPYARVGIGNVFTYASYHETTAYSGDNTKPCVATSAGALNHFEVDLSQGQIQVWGTGYSTDGGQTFPAMQLLALVPLALPFSVGYVHYQVGIRAPAKYLQQFNLNAPYALYHWKDLGFDGPAGAPDRVYQAPDALTLGPSGGQNLGYQLIDGTLGIPQGMYTCCQKAKAAPFTLQQVNLAGATGAQLTFDAYAVQADSFNSSTFNIQYRLNGGPWQALSPAPPYQALLNQACGSCPGAPTSENWWMALAVPVPLSALVAGTNTLEFTTANASEGYPVILANVDLVVSTNTAPAPVTGTPVPPTATATSTIDPPAPTATSTIDPPAPTATATPITQSGGTSACRFESASSPVSVAFCETFNQPAGIGNRSGGLNGTLWGVSRWTGNTNLGFPLGWAPVQENRCGTTVLVQPENDVSICNGRLVEGTDDATNVTSVAMYPKQPFDFAGRTGTVVFDVSNNSQGSHAAWPEFWMTDKPVPAPFIHEGPGGSQNSFGVRFAAACPAGQGANCGQSCPSTNTTPVFTVDSAVVVRNWQVFDTFTGTGNGLTVTDLNCVTESTDPSQLNHIELRISQNEIDVYATDAGTTAPLKEIATITNANLTLTRGLIWLEDVHYNGNKLNSQRTNTFSWDNVGFDGPTLPRDLAFDVNDSLTPAGSLADGSNGVFLGWEVPADGTTLSLAVPNVSGIAQASSGLLTYNFYSYNPGTISYSLNSGPWHAIPWPYPDNTTYVLRSVAIPINLSEVRAGTNTIQFTSSDPAVIANIDLIMVGAGGIAPPSS